MGVRLARVLSTPNVEFLRHGPPPAYARCPVAGCGPVAGGVDLGRALVEPLVS